MVRGVLGSVQSAGVELRCGASQLEALLAAGVGDQELEDLDLFSRALGLAVEPLEPVQHGPGARVRGAGGLEGGNRAPRRTHLLLQDLGPLELEGAEAAGIRR